MAVNVTDARHLRALGLRIKALRRESSLSQEQLADKAGVHRTYIGMLERGEKNLTLLSALKVSNALDVTVSHLLEGFGNGE